MISRKAIVLAVGPNASLLHPLTVATSSTSSLRGTRSHEYSAERVSTYATVAGDVGHEANRAGKSTSEHVWPTPLRGHNCPTPYQIFDLKQNQQYTKAKYFELVKIYHPDRDGCHVTSISPALRTERYRLVVAAHTILSDPIKRSAYDRFGSGWNGKAEVGAQPNWNASDSAGGPPPGPFSQSWRDGSGPDPIWQNATWEDWERWHDRQAGHTPSEPVFMRNGSFLACVIALAIIGGSMNYGRAQDAGTYFVEQRDIVHDRAAKELRRVRQEKQSISSRQDRIDYFLRQREATMGANLVDLAAIREERASRILPNRDVCRSDEVREQD